MHHTAIAFVATVLGMISVVSAQVDETLQPNAKGLEVVEAVRRKIEASCIFSEDKLFMRRLAYVESTNGEDSKTFRLNYFGGIWQVDKDKFDLTQSSSAAAILQPYTRNIARAFRINWSSVVWKDLTKPLLSALAARLFFTYASRNDQSGIPRDIPDQGVFWRTYYRTTVQLEVFVNKANQLEAGCQNTVGPDIVFVLDGSGSIEQQNFEKIKAFVADVIKYFDVGSGTSQAQFGVIQYGSESRIEFHLKTYVNKIQILNAVKNIVYNNGGTRTDLALDQMTVQGFSENNGARALRNGHPRVGIVVTDGQSNEQNKTVAAARNAHRAGLTLFAVGIGAKIDVSELNAIASNPPCAHVMLLANFTEFTSLKYAVEKKTCEAPNIIGPENNHTVIQLPSGKSQNCKIKIPTVSIGVTIKLTTLGGKTTFYSARSTYPSSSFYEDKVEASHGQPAYLPINKSSTRDLEGLIFCKIVGDQRSDTNNTIDFIPQILTPAARSSMDDDNKDSQMKNQGTRPNPFSLLLLLLLYHYYLFGKLSGGTP